MIVRLIVVEPLVKGQILLRFQEVFHILLVDVDHFLQHLQFQY